MKGSKSQSSIQQSNQAVEQIASVFEMRAAHSEVEINKKTIETDQKVWKTKQNRDRGNVIKFKGFKVSRKTIFRFQTHSRSVKNVASLGSKIPRQVMTFFKGL